MAALFSNPEYRAFDDNGNPLPGALLNFYLTGTTTPTDTYTDNALTTPHANPVVADAGGQFPAIYLDPTTTYRAILEDALLVQQWDIDPLGTALDFQPGTVIMFNGLPAARDAAYPPAQWQVMDGTNGTFDLRDRFPIAAGSTYAAGDTGGALMPTTSIDGLHDHGAAVGGTALTEAQSPVHNHRLWSDNSTAQTETVGLGASNCETVSGRTANVTQLYVEDAGEDGQQLVEDAGSGATHTHTISADGSHSHTVDITPPFGALWFLQRRV